MKTGTKNKIKTFKIKILGIVQGVGFRPFIFNLAHEYKISGMVTNTTEGVLITANGSPKLIHKFIHSIKERKPSPAIIENIEVKEEPFTTMEGFSIEKSKKGKRKFQLISPDLATCKECIKDIHNQDDSRRYLYPFTNCTNCGPRFTIIEKLPYDRPYTTMKKFKKCSQCEKEYLDPRDRRFHAQPIACNKCGPTLSLVDSKGHPVTGENPINLAAQKILKGKIIGIKSLGGFQLACNAVSDDVVGKLRQRKKRPFKPFAVMIKNIEEVKKQFKVTEKEINSLLSSRAPIVLIRKGNSRYLSEYVSFYNQFEGIMLPYTPIHHLLFKYLDIPLIMTSGNITEEPIAAKNNQAKQKLNKICDYFLIHDRGIYSRYDDSVVKIFDNREMLIRRARGYSPYPVKLSRDIKDKTILALGAQEKNTFCIYKERYGIVSQHLGDLDSLESNLFFEETIKKYRDLFNIRQIDIIATDKHPAYSSTKYAANFDKSIPRHSFQHHKAHIASVMAENNIEDNLLGFSWDGTGYGDDGKIWGSEIFLIKENIFSRIGHLREKYIPGGEVSIRKPYRMALSYLYKYQKLKDKGDNFTSFIYDNFPFYKDILNSMEANVIASQADSGYNSPLTTSMGRFFDAISSLLNLTHLNSYEGEAAIHLEMAANNSHNGFYKIDMDAEKFVIDDFNILEQIIKDIHKGITVDIISAKFHNTLAKAVLDISQKIRENYGIEIIALSGGVFQNNLLLRKCFTILRENKFKVFTNFKVPVNDGGISLGQAYLASNYL